jgi:hypothetical protein
LNWEATLQDKNSRKGGLGYRLHAKSCVRLALPFLAALIPLFAAVSFASPQTSPPTEYQLKAAFLFNFAKFIDWPDKSFPTPQSPFTLCVIGQDPFGGALDEYLAKTMGGRPVQLAHFPNANILSGARRCQIVFVSGSEKSHFHNVIESLSGTNSLLIGDTDGFAAAGGAIEFMLEDNHIRFVINPDAAGRADLKVSSKLLALAKIVHEEPKSGKN